MERKKERYEEKKCYQIRIDHWLFEEANKYGEEEGRKFNNLITELLKKYIEEKEK